MRSSDPAATVRAALMALAIALGPSSVAAAVGARADPAPDAVLALFPGADAVGAFGGEPRAAEVRAAGRVVGHAFLTDDVVPLPAYSGKPVSVLVGIDLDARITGARIVAHEEPILVVGVSEADLARFVGQYVGADVHERIRVGGRASDGTVAVDGISGATITVMVINASIVRAARAVAVSRGLPASARAAGGSAMEPVYEAPWVQVWHERRPRIAVLVAGLTLLTIILFLQDWIARYPRALGRLRTAFLLYTVLFVGWYSLGQLSVVNVFTFLRALVTGFAWETFLIEPTVFVLWAFVAVTLVLWGRGVYCGWLCPFGALQELVSKGARRLGVPQLAVPALVHERLVAIKYVLLVGLFGLSLHAMPEAVRVAEVEPFKTAFTLRFDRPAPFVAYALALIAVSAVNGKLFCKYLCPLGAALAIGSHFRIFDWLRRRRECGRPCQTCAVHCPSQAIRPTGEIVASECHHCLDCQVTFWDAYRCPPLVERRRRAERRGGKLRLAP